MLAAFGPLRRGISIHTALAGCDLTDFIVYPVYTKISIHTALAGCDTYSKYWSNWSD